MRVIQIPVLSDNYCYLVICEQTLQAAVVDPPEADIVLKTIEKEGLTLVAILNTHHHWDHVGANEELMQHHQLKVFGFQEEPSRIPGLSHPVHEGDSISIGELSLKVLEVPGHTRSHVAYVGHGALFCGDTLFLGGSGRLFEGTPADMVSSLTKIRELPDDTYVYCAHEYSQQNLEFTLTIDPTNPSLQKKYQEVLTLRQNKLSAVPSTIGEEKSYNLFLRWDDTHLIQNLQKDHPELNADPASIFSEIRNRKDAY